MHGRGHHEQWQVVGQDGTCDVHSAKQPAHAHHSNAPGLLATSCGSRLAQAAHQLQLSCLAQ